MKKDLTCVMLVDDNQNDNFFHERAIKKANSKINVVIENSGINALKYLKSNRDNKLIEPSLIFLDINMPNMNGWDFLHEYNKLEKELQIDVVIIMLTSSDNEDDVARVKALDFVADYITKPLTKEVMEDIIKKYFN